MKKYSTKNNKYKLFSIEIDGVEYEIKDLTNQEMLDFANRLEELEKAEKSRSSVGIIKATLNILKDLLCKFNDIPEEIVKKINFKDAQEIISDFLNAWTPSEENDNKKK